MTDEPTPIGDALRVAKAKLRQVSNAADPLDALEPEDLAAIRASGLDRLSDIRWSASVPSRFASADLANVGGPPGDAVRGWVATNGPRPNLVFLGPVGVGKTYAAIAACRDDHRAGLEVRFLPVVELLDQLRPGGPESAFSELCEVDRLIIDDLGHERPTDWTAERLEAVVNRRWLEQRPTIATTNLEPEALQAGMGGRTYSRLVRSGAVVVRITGDDRRKDG